MTTPSVHPNVVTMLVASAANAKTRLAAYTEHLKQVSAVVPISPVHGEALADAVKNLKNQITNVESELASLSAQLSALPTEASPAATSAVTAAAAAAAAAGPAPAAKS